jgi:hypothetical protein
VGGPSKLWQIGCGVKRGMSERTLDDEATRPVMTAGTQGAVLGDAKGSSPSQVLRTVK